MILRSKPMAFSVLEDVKLIELPRHIHADGDLVVLEKRSGMPFAAERIFTVHAVRGAVRGRHAHRECAQILMCLVGAIEVECDDGGAKRTFQLDRPDFALLIPPSIWATETYRGDGSVLTVLCDRPYDEVDYIRDYSEYLVWRQKGPAQ